MPWTKYDWVVGGYGVDHDMNMETARVFELVVVYRAIGLGICLMFSIYSQH